MKTISQFTVLAVTMVLAPSSHAAATLTVIHALSGSLQRDSVEEGMGVNGLVLGSDGNFYGTTTGGGPGAVWNAGCGTIFRIVPGGAFTTLHSFSGTDGQGPSGGFYYEGGTLVQGNDGNFYGRTVAGGIGHVDWNPDHPAGACNPQSPTGYGTIFRITPDGSLKTLVFFNGTNGSGPSSLLLARDGNFYGTTAGGGAYSGLGTLFRMTPEGTLTTLVSFNGTNGSGPSALLQGQDGSFYGTMLSGGTSGQGGVFKMTPDGTVSTFASFTRDPNAYPPYSLMQASDGNFYGTMFQGGICSNPYDAGPCGYAGTIFKVTTAGELRTLVKFNFSNGAWPIAPLVEGADGNLYGSTSQGGPRTDFPSGGWDHVGTLFKMTPDGKLTTLVFFDSRNGLYPYGQLVQAGDGNFYGTTFNSGTNNVFGPGEIFRLTVPGADAPKIISMTNSGSEFSLSWLSLRGRSYQLEFTSDFPQANWSSAGDAVTAINSTTTAAAFVGSDKERFYRVVLKP